MKKLEQINLGWLLMISGLFVSAPNLLMGIFLIKKVVPGETFLRPLYLAVGLGLAMVISLGGVYIGHTALLHKRMRRVLFAAWLFCISGSAVLITTSLVASQFPQTPLVEILTWGWISDHYFLVAVFALIPALPDVVVVGAFVALDVKGGHRRTIEELQQKIAALEASKTDLERGNEHLLEVAMPKKRGTRPNYKAIALEVLKSESKYWTLEEIIGVAKMKDIELRVPTLRNALSKLVDQNFAVRVGAPPEVEGTRFVFWASEFYKEPIS